MNKTLRHLLLVLATFPLLTVSAEWPQFRGPDGQGHSSATDLPSTWDAEKNIAWRTETPGRGWSSPLIDGDTIWLTTAYETEASEEEKQKRLEKDTGGQKLTVLSKLKLTLLKIDRETGKIEDELTLLELDEPQWVHELNSYASPTPIIEDNRLYAQFGAFGTVAVDTKEFEVLWKNTDLHCMHENGPGGSPTLHGDHLIFHLDGSDTQSIVALDKHTGNVAWKTMRSGEMHENPQLKKAYGTPLVVGGTLVSSAANWVYGYDPVCGEERWRVPYGQLGFSNVARPVAANGKVFICTGFMKSSLMAIDLRDDQPSVAWTYKKGVPKMPSPIVVGDEIYFIDDKIGLATCLDATTGEEHWRERLGGKYSASPLYADGKLYFFEQEGKTVVLEPGPSFKKLAECSIEDERQMASPAAVGKAIYLRTNEALYRIEK